jgi:putative transposase
LKSSATFFAAELDRPHALMVDYIDAHKDEFGIEPICRCCSSPRRPTTRQDPAALGRALRDAVLMPLLLALWIANYRVYGARKLWKADAACRPRRRP